MKKAAEYARRVKQLFQKIKREKAKSNLATADEPLKVLLLGILSNYASEQKAAAALGKLYDAAIDYNDLRVTPVADMVEIVGTNYPKVRAAAEEISQVLNSIFNHTHSLDVNFLESGSKKSADSFLSSLDGLSGHARAFFKQRCHNAQVIPLDVNMYAYLQRSEYIAEDVDVDEAQKFLLSVIKDRDRMNFYAMFKRYAATHAPRKTVTKESVTSTLRKSKTRSAETKAVKVAKKKAKKKVSTARKKSGKKTTRKKTARAKVARKSAGKKKTSSKKSKSRKTARRR